MGRRSEHLGVKGVLFRVAGPVVVGVGGSSLGLTRAGQEECIVPGRLAPHAGQLSEQRNPVPATSKLRKVRQKPILIFIVTQSPIHIGLRCVAAAVSLTAFWLGLSPPFPPMSTINMKVLAVRIA